MALDKLPDFLEANGDKIINERVAYYELLTGKKLQPAHVERLVIQESAYRELLLREAINSATKQMFVSTASAPMLDYLGELVGVVRLAPSYAETVIRFELEPTQNGVVIPAGTRVQSKDGNATFSTKENCAVAAGIDFAEVSTVCGLPGATGNGYIVGSVSEILDPLPFVLSAANTDVSSGGSESETDDALRVRIKLAPASFSVAGPKNAYKYFAKSANPLITDVAVTNPVPGTVEIFPLVAGGIVTPQSVINDVIAACNADDVRPLCDTVIVTAPGKIDYTIVADVTLYDDADANLVSSAITAALTAFTAERAKLLGRDVIGDQIKAKCVIDGVYKVDLNGFVDLVIAETEFANCTGITVNIIGTNVG